jgi:hypothetical protein
MRQELIARLNPAPFHVMKPAIENFERGMPWMFAPPSPSLLESRWK